MRYQVMMLDVQKDYYCALKHRFEGMDVNFTMALTMQDASHLCAEQSFHLLILAFPDSVLCSEFLIALRRVTFAPIITLLSKYNIENARSLLQAGADLCIDPNWPIDLGTDHIAAQFRRYTNYNQSEHQQGGKDSFIHRGDIYLHPQRHIVCVRERSVKLRRREFLLLKYFMENPHVILSSDRICEQAWGNEGCYMSGVSSPIAVLRKAIEPDPANPIYIITVKTLGYYFTAYSSETCDICCDSVGIL